MVRIPRAVAADATSWPIRPAPMIARCRVVVSASSSAIASSRVRSVSACGKAASVLGVAPVAISALSNCRLVEAGDALVAEVDVVVAVPGVRPESDLRPLAARNCFGQRRAVVGQLVAVHGDRAVVTELAERLGAPLRREARADEDDSHAVTPLGLRTGLRFARRAMRRATAGTAVASMNARNQVDWASVPAPSVWIRPRT